jgi:hypothetical protein
VTRLWAGGLADAVAFHLKRHVIDAKALHLGDRDLEDLLALARLGHDGVRARE